MVLVADGGGGGGSFSVTPADIFGAGETFATGQSRLSTIIDGLVGVVYDSGGMAGGDDAGHAFATRYDPAARATMSTLLAGTSSIGGAATGLVTTANNYLKAEHHSDARGHGAPPLFPAPLVFDSEYVGDPPTAAGPSSFGSGLLGKFWPQGHTGTLRSTADAWRKAGTDLQTLGDDLHSSVINLMDYNDAASLRAFRSFWNHIWGGDGGSQPVLSAAVTGCHALADACDKFASAIDSAHHKLELLAAGAGVATGIGIGLTVFTLGLSDAAAGGADAAITSEAATVAAGFAADVTTDVAAAIEAELVPMLESAAAAAPEAVAVEAETVPVSEALDEELSAAESTTPSGAGGGEPGGGAGGGAGDEPPVSPSPHWTPDDGTPVLGRLDDTSVAKDWPDHAVLDDPDWTLDRNMDWVQSIIDQKGEVYVGSPTTAGNLVSEQYGQTVFARELQAFLKAGYTWSGDTLVPPP